ncbi:hypothetical protein COX86_00145 [Candidatus Micrarchaeota archaeon CG_4_10_14_0_2_um_filter_60_11]|nr:MAG: hypothetical protein COT58_01215 [Candidatus Micrarchaeota archaeon CG09_land_8_20_14_0_10_60_16]PIY91380.1 MAG: hypothetical protein COY71_03490 [Candidatus Micrarchaeota archaeon CG_4_10_14_0_8_um_filter_60_7]PIZ91354.1 MAG: hypothetical protein COX86_00145 [Candidatus Micrarchaeota archaeon CG_4_10_14_0_2_um_filter_60_11]
MLKQCPACGKLDAKGEFSGAFCPECEARENPQSAPKEKKRLAQYCAKCGKHWTRDGWVKGAPTEKHFTRTCLECTLESGGYHEAVIQVRGPHDEARRLMTNLARQIRKITFITAIHDEKFGYDIYVGRKRGAFEAIRALDLHCKKTNKLITQTREGKPVYRATYCVRIPEPKKAGEAAEEGETEE